MPRRYAEPIDRILANSVLSLDGNFRGTRCWDWTGKRKRNRSGQWYGVLNIRFQRGPRKGKVHTVYVHRWVLTKIKGRRLGTRIVGMHLCNNTLCCNPDHLGGGTQRTNIKQAVRQGRHRGNVKC